MLKYAKHFSELRSRIIRVIIFFIFSCFLGYYIKDYLYYLIIKPLIAYQKPFGTREIIYTNLTEAFVTYIKLSCTFGAILSIPMFAYHMYAFISPALYKREKLIVKLLLIAGPILFYIGVSFMFLFVVPKAWGFFLSFESIDGQLSLQAKISEYVDLVIHFGVAFGLAFEIPIILIILNTIGLISIDSMIKYRRIAIVINFIIAGIITPPDALSQISLAIPMILLYEGAIIICKKIN